MSSVDAIFISYNSEYKSHRMIKNENSAQEKPLHQYFRPPQEYEACLQIPKQMLGCTSSYHLYLVPLGLLPWADLDDLHFMSSSIWCASLVSDQ
jgi:hypothetical protein